MRPFIVIVALLVSPALGWAEPPLKVAISPFEPFVFLNSDKPTGFSVDLWKALAEELGVEYELVRFKGVEEKLKALQEGKVDVAVGGVTVTGQREAIFDFSHPTFHTGLDILVLSEGSQIWGIIKSLFTWDLMTLVMGFLCFVTIVGHLFWRVERRYDFDGTFDGAYFTVTTTSSTGYGDKAPRTKLGKVMAMTLMLVAMPGLSMFTAVITSYVTTERLQGSITSPSDLADKRVGVVKGTASASVVREYEATPVPYPNITAAKKALLKRKIKAVVYDAPNLRYLAQRDKAGKVGLVGKQFKRQRYAIALPEESPWTEKINVALLALLEKGEFNRLEKKWFGAE